MTLRGFIIRVGRGLVDKSGHLFEENLFPIETEKNRLDLLNLAQDTTIPKNVHPLRKESNLPSNP